MASLSSLSNVFGGNKNPTTMPVQIGGNGTKTLTNIYSNTSSSAPFATLNQTLDAQANKPKPVATPTKPVAAPNFLQQVAGGVEKAASDIIDGIKFSFVQPTINSPIPKSQMVQNTPAPGVSEISSVPIVGKALQVASGALPETEKLLQQLVSDPLSLKANPEKMIIDAWNSIKEPVSSYLKSSILIGLNTPPVPKNVGQGLNQVSTSAQVLFSPITALFSAANDIPVVASLSKILTLPFSAVGEGGTKVSNKIVDSLPISNQAKAQIKPGLGQIVSLAAQIGLGEGIGLATKGRLESTFGPTDTNTIIQQAQEVARTANRDLIDRVTKGQGSAGDLRQYNLLSQAGLLRQVATKPGEAKPTIQSLLQSGENNPKDLMNTVFQNKLEKTPEGKAIVKSAMDAQSQGMNINIEKTGESAKIVTPKDQAMIEQYRQRFPDQLLNTDNVRELWAPEGYNRINSAEFQSPARDLSEKIFNQDLQTLKPGDNYLFSAGASGAGKTTALSQYPDLTKDVKAGMDTNFSSQSSLDKLQKVIETGAKPTVTFVYRDPLDAWNNGVVKRAINPDDRRVVPAQVFIDNLENSPKTVLKAYEQFNGKVSIQVIDNSHGAGNAKVVEDPIAFLRSISYNVDDVKQQIIASTKEQISNGTIQNPETGKSLLGSYNSTENDKLTQQGSNNEQSVHPEVRPESNSSAITESSKSPGVSEPVVEEPEYGSTTLGVELIPGLSKFFSEDVLPTVNAVKEAAQQTTDVINPPRASAAANKASNVVREALAKVENYESLVAGKYQSYQKFFGRYGDDANIENISHYERTGQFLEEPKPKDGQPTYSQTYHDSMVDSYKILRAAYGKDETGFIDNYVRRAFVFANTEEELKGAEALGNFTRSLSANKSPLKRRVLDMPLDEAFKDMKERGINVKMRTTNPEELRQWSLVNAKRAMVYKGAWNDLKQSKLIAFVRDGGKRPAGFVPLNDRAAEVFAPAEIHYGAGEKISEKGYQGTVPVGRYWADPSVSRIMNNVISSGLEEIKLFKAARLIGNQMNSFQLGISAFHLTGSAINAGFSDMALGMRNVLQGKPISGAVKLTRGIIPGASFTRDLYHGRQFMNDLRKDDPEAMKIIDTLINPAGGRITRDKKYNDDLTTQVKKALANGNLFGAALRTPGAIVESVAHPLLGYSIPRVKIGAFLDLAHNILTRLPADATYDQKQTALSRAWNSIDNRFGQLVYSNLFWNKVGKDIAMLTTRSVGWNLGDIRELGGGILKDPIQTMIRGKERINNKFSERFSDRMLFSVSLILGTSILGAIYQYLHTGQTPGELKDYFFPKDGGTDTNGNPTRRSLPTYWKDVYAFSTDPLGTIGNKVSPAMSTILQLWNNKDYYGNLIRNPNDPATQQLEQAGQYFLQNILPFSLQSATQGSQTPIQKVEGFLGITKAPARIIQSQKQQDLIKAYQNQVGLPSPKTPEQVATQDLKTKAYQEIKQNGWRSSASFKALVTNGTLNTRLKQVTFIKNAQKTGVQRMESHLPKATRRQFSSM